MNLRKGQLFDTEALKEIWHITPDQVVDFQALVGDSIDNVPGVPLIGPKIAGQLLQEFGDLEGLFANVDQVKGAKRQQNLKAHQQQVLVSRQLVALVPDLVLDVDWGEAQVGPPDAQDLLSLCREFGFRGFANRVAEAAEAELAPVEWQADYKILTEPEVCSQFAQQLAARERLGLFPVLRFNGRISRTTATGGTGGGHRTGNRIVHARVDGPSVTVGGGGCLAIRPASESR